MTTHMNSSLIATSTCVTWLAIIADNTDYHSQMTIVRVGSDIVLSWDLINTNPVFSNAHPVCHWRHVMEHDVEETLFDSIVNAFHDVHAQDPAMTYEDLNDFFATLENLIIA